MKVGLEIECGLYRPLFSFIPDSYHTSARSVCLGGLWGAERDASVTPQQDDYLPVEFILRTPATSKSSLVHALDVLYDQINPDGYSYPEAMEINRSMGAHIHFSHADYQHRQVYPFVMLNYIKKEFAKRLQARSMASYRAWKKQYDRYYAEDIKTRQKLYNKWVYGGRQLAFNATRNTGMEWRSFNLAGTNNWDDFYFYYMTAWDVIEEAIDKNKSNGFKEKATTNIVADVQDKDMNITINKSARNVEELPDFNISINVIKRKKITIIKL